MSQYSYAGDDPCNNSDPTGMTTCYHKVTAAQVHKKVYQLTSQVNGLNEGAAVAAGAAAVEAPIPIVQAATIPTLILAAIAAADSAHIAQEANVLQNGPDGSGNYWNGFTVQYTSNLLWFDEPCASGDATTRPSGTIVSGSPFDMFVPSH